MNLEHYIDGRHAPSVSGATFPVLEPTTNEPYATASAGGPEDVDAAVAAAHRAFTDGPWPRMSGQERAAVLRRIATAIESRDEEIAALECRDTGLPITQARGQARRAAHNFRFFADVITTLSEDVYRVASAQLNYVLRKPVGVAGLITPWNTPFMLETWKLAPALAAGCPVVLKPAEWSPLSAGVLPEVMEEAGLPAGVFNMVHGIGEDAGAALVAHPDVPVISFTGETGTGQTIMRAAADHLKTLSMELGGKSPLLVFDDADLERALDAAVFGVFSLNGERCTASSRVLVHEAVYETFVERLADRAARVRVGAPDDPDTELGALIHREHYDRVLDYVRVGTEEGARLVAGGTRPPGIADGNFLSATVFADVTPGMRVFQEEIFGPVVCVTPFTDEAQALELANATRYGLAAYLWTNDVRRVHRMAQSLEAGMLWVNSQNVRDLRTPFGGVKASGLGREGGRHSIDVYTESHIVHVATEELPVLRFGTA
ncbi:MULTISPECIES: 5-carboxymethyl-2-hydroxymuconate semialdehyde dehydrogenase [Streptomyces]|uniref:5-carboxymethyl-2-hydroxymuconate semialdehyde dehydrogenase n=1 Tax=Streptomyces TaxID=1883 RepID=UPI002248933D|nr:5-carboxymethyl-2-hydroxymuconate semialdehyde dehydrogenase [Streptomyces sp. JHD 1]MCX2970242.1 5-carboxymethyl-2-hydroxymuconate semialdehyde dehydrogenase [Streptomyces sp. JHD 1]